MVGAMPNAWHISATLPLLIPCRKIRIFFSGDRPTCGFLALLTAVQSPGLSLNSQSSSREGTLHEARNIKGNSVSTTELISSPKEPNVNICLFWMNCSDCSDNRDSSCLVALSEGTKRVFVLEPTGAARQLRSRKVRPESSPNQ